jgi:hypothetical protein
MAKCAPRRRSEKGRGYCDHPDDKRRQRHCDQRRDAEKSSGDDETVATEANKGLLPDRN